MHFNSNCCIHVIYQSYRLILLFCFVLLKEASRETGNVYPVLNPTSVVPEPLPFFTGKPIVMWQLNDLTNGWMHSGTFINCAQYSVMEVAQPQCDIRGSLKALILILSLCLWVADMKYCGKGVTC